MRRRITFLVLFLLVSRAEASSFTGPVVSVLDGDTIEVLHNGKAERMRLNGIDAPEKGQDYGRRAKQYVEELTRREEVSVETADMDKYGRTIADVFLSDGRHLNKELVKAGMAWWYCRYSSDSTLKDLEEEARDSKRGLWHDPVPIPPWVFRKLQKKQVPDIADFDCPAVKPQGESRMTPSVSSATATGEVVGNKRSHVYHRPDCPGYTATAPKNRKMFTNPAEAEAAGYRLAGNCPS